MLPPSKIGIFFWTWKQAIQSCRRPATLLPFAGYAAVQLFVLASLVFFIYPPFSAIFMPLQRALYGEITLHYPNNYIVMPQMFETLNIVLSGVLGIWVIGRATVLFFSSNEAQRGKSVVKPIGRRYFHLLGAWFGETLLALLVIGGFMWLSGKMPSASIYLNTIRVFGVVGVSAIFAFSNALILIEEKPFWVALPQSAKMFASYALVTFFLVGLPTIMQLPIQFLLSNSAQIVRRLNPEMITVVIATGVFLAMLSNYFIVGTVTHLYRGISRDAKVVLSPR
jgi:hypothetical protein